MAETFSVCQFLVDDSHEYVRQNVETSNAVEAAIHYATSVAARMGLTRRVIITDNDDSICWEWKWDEGITFGAGPQHIGKLKYGIR